MVYQKLQRFHNLTNHASVDSYKRNITRTSHPDNKQTSFKIEFKHETIEIPCYKNTELEAKQTEQNDIQYQ